jgi:hypothetical protein
VITFDPYEIRARIIPTLVVLAPIGVIPLAFGMSLSSDWLGSAIAGLAAASLLYLASLVVRFFGKKTEAELWRTWGGPPSMLLLRSGDRTFPDSTKTRIRSCVRREFGIELDGLEEINPDWPQRVGEAFRLVRQRIRQHDPNGLWYLHSAEYGALRNFYGVANFMAALASLSAVLCLVALQRRYHGGAIQVSLFVLSLVLIPLPLVARSWLLPPMLRAAAFQYAESAWLCFLHCCTEGGAEGGKTT